MKTLHFTELFEDIPVKITYCNAPQVREHKHDFFELVYVCEGKAEHIFENKTVIIQKGDFFLINLHSSHQYRAIGSDSAFAVINCLFLPRLIDESLKDARSFQDILDRYLPQYGGGRFDESPTQKIFHDESGFVGEITKNILLEFEEKKVGYSDVIRNLLMTLILYLVRREAPCACDPTEQTIRDIKTYVGRHYMHPLRLSNICREMNFSVPYISALFRRECGITFREYLIRVRIEKSCQLLRGAKMTVQEISSCVGYSDPAFFYKTFRREMSVSPDEYRCKNQVAPP